MLFRGGLVTKLGEHPSRHLAFGVAEGSDLGQIQLLQIAKVALVVEKKVTKTSNNLIPK